MRVHLIAIGGSAMHNMAIAMHKKGYEVTGSDDEIFEPSKTRLANLNLLPTEIGWFPEKINATIDAVILGMHARADNPELAKAKELELKIYSYPEYIYEQTKNKTRIVIGGSHGKTTITSMILHVFKHAGIDCDYMVGAQLQGFDAMVKLTEGAKFAIIEGDEYLSSPIDRRPKFHLYYPNIAIISGIAWDHINVFPTFDNYVDQFRIYINKITDGGSLIYCENDAEVKKLAEEEKQKNRIKLFSYSTPDYKIENGITILKNQIPLLVFGEHNLMNFNAAKLACEQAGISESVIYDAIKSFKGAAKRLELVAKNETTAVYKDFAHSPSKLKATTAAMKQQYPKRKLIACMELHTFSSLNENFLAEYKNAMADADEAIVYFNPHTIEHKKLKPITSEQVKMAFASDNVTVFTDSDKIKAKLLSKTWQNANLLLMTSGNFDGLDFIALSKSIVFNLII
jgi:UDP-N-acetylmuramate: L-alanyl-gamma-D-glutamyl-meso-diaminopimelate ligase